MKELERAKSLIDQAITYRDSQTILTEYQEQAIFDAVKRAISYLLDALFID